MFGPETIFSPDSQLERLYQGSAFAEGPAADAEGNVYFSDCPNNRILVYRPATGQTSVWQEPSLRANGMNFDAQGRLVVCCDGKDGGARAVRRYEPDGTITTLASHYQDKKLNAPLTPPDASISPTRAMATKMILNRIAWPFIASSWMVR
jgi:gluconolactonase